MKKIGIMGGTFNPIHYGHLFLAENAFDQIGLDRIQFMPSKNPPHKLKPDMVTDEQRVDMIKLAIGGNPHFEVSTLELEREGLTFTADTLTILTRENPDMHYYFIVGADSLFMMHEWKNPQVVFKHCTVVAAGRDNVEQESLKQQAEYLKEQFHADIRLLQMPTIQISSADIRSRLSEGKTVRYYLPDLVIAYMKENQLYGIV